MPSVPLDSWELKYIKILHNIFLSILRTGFQISDICGDFVNQVIYPVVWALSILLVWVLSGSMYVSVCLTGSFCLGVSLSMSYLSCECPSGYICCLFVGLCVSLV